MELWKEQIARSYWLRDFWKGRNGRANHPVFGDRKDGYVVPCQKCGRPSEFRSIRNGELEYAFCRECYREYIKGREEGKPPKKNQGAIKA